MIIIMVSWALSKSDLALGPTFQNITPINGTQGKEQTSSIIEYQQYVDAATPVKTRRPTHYMMFKEDGSSQRIQTNLSTTTEGI